MRNSRLQWSVSPWCLNRPMASTRNLDMSSLLKILRSYFLKHFGFVCIPWELDRDQVEQQTEQGDMEQQCRCHCCHGSRRVHQRRCLEGERRLWRCNSFTDTMWGAPLAVPEQFRQQKKRTRIWYRYSAMFPLFPSCGFSIWLHFSLAFRTLDFLLAQIYQWVLAAFVYPHVFLFHPSRGRVGTLLPTCRHFTSPELRLLPWAWQDL